MIGKLIALTQKFSDLKIRIFEQEKPKNIVILYNIKLPLQEIVDILYKAKYDKLILKIATGLLLVKQARPNYA